MPPPETRSQQQRLDQHEEQLQLLQADVNSIKSSLQAWEADRAQEEEIRKFLLAWVKQQGQIPISNSAEVSGLSGDTPIRQQPGVNDLHSLPGGSGSSLKPPEFPSGGNPSSPIGDSSGAISAPSWTATKVKLPEFQGFDPQGWIKRAELYFDIHGTPPHLRIRMAQLSMVGVAQHWFTIVHQIYDSLSWEQLTRELLQRFSGLEIQNPYEQLSTIQQVDSIHDYIDDFEYLLSLVPCLPESQSLGYFLAGLRPEVRRWVRLHRPQTRLDAMYLAKDVEEMLQPSEHQALQSRFRYQAQSSFVDKNTGGSLFDQMGQHGYKAQSLTSGGECQKPFRVENYRTSSNSTIGGSVRNEVSQISTFQNSSPRNRGFRTLSRTEWEERRKKGMCFKCGQQFGPSHKCPEASLRVMLLAEDEEFASTGDLRTSDLVTEEERTEQKVNHSESLSNHKS